MNANGVRLEGTVATSFLREERAAFKAVQSLEHDKPAKPARASEVHPHRRLGASSQDTRTREAGKGAGPVRPAMPLPFTKEWKSERKWSKKGEVRPLCIRPPLLAVTKFLSHRRPAHRRAAAAQGHSMTADTPASVPAAQPAADGETLTRFRSSEEQALRPPPPPRARLATSAHVCVVWRP